MPFIEQPQGPDFGAAIASVGEALIESTKAKARIDNAAKGGGGIDPTEELFLTQLKKDANDYAAGLGTTDDKGNFAVNPSGHLEAYDKRHASTIEGLNKRGINPDLIANFDSWSVTKRETVRDRADRYGNAVNVRSFTAGGQSVEAQNLAGGRTVDEIIADFGSVQGQFDTLSQNRFSDPIQLGRITEGLYDTQLFSAVRGLAKEGRFGDAEKVIVAAQTGKFVVDEGKLDRARRIYEEEGRTYARDQMSNLESDLQRAADADISTAGMINPFGRWESIVKAHPIASDQAKPILVSAGVNLYSGVLEQATDFVASQNNIMSSEGVTASERQSLLAMIESAESLIKTLPKDAAIEGELGELREELQTAKENANKVGERENDIQTLRASPPEVSSIVDGTDERIRDETNEALMQNAVTRDAFFAGVGLGHYRIAGGAADVLAGLESSSQTDRSKAYKALVSIYQSSPGSPDEKQQTAVDALRSMTSEKGKDYAIVANAYLDPSLSQKSREIFKNTPYSIVAPVLRQMEDVRIFADKESAKLVAGGADLTEAIGKGKGTVVGESGAVISFDKNKYNEKLAPDMYQSPVGFSQTGESFNLGGVVQVVNQGLVRRMEAEATAALITAAKGGREISTSFIAQTMVDMKDKVYGSNLVAVDQPANQAAINTLMGFRTGGYPVSSVLYVGIDGPFVQDGKRNDERIVSMQKAIGQLTEVQDDAEGWGSNNYINFQLPSVNQDKPNVVEFPIYKSENSAVINGYLRVDFKGDKAKVTKTVTPSEFFSPQAKAMDMPGTIKSFGWQPQFGLVTLEDFDPSGYRLDKYASYVDRYYPGLTGQMRKTKIIEEIYNDGWSGIRSNQGNATV